jgi:hypothetical protein
MMATENVNRGILSTALAGPSDAAAPSQLRRAAIEGFETHTHESVSLETPLLRVEDFNL